MHRFHSPITALKIEAEQGIMKGRTNCVVESSLGTGFQVCGLCTFIRSSEAVYKRITAAGCLFGEGIDGQVEDT